MNMRKYTKRPIVSRKNANLHMKDFDLTMFTWESSANSV